MYLQLFVSDCAILCDQASVSRRITSVNKKGIIPCQKYPGQTAECINKCRKSHTQKEKNLQAAGRFDKNNNNHFEDWDSNDDYRLDSNEWNMNAMSYYTNNGIEKEGRFDNFDTNNDNYVDEIEYEDGTFNMLDNDDNGYLSRMEYKKFSDRNTTMSMSKKSNNRSY